MKILVTGGAGYIGSHTVIELLAENYDVVVFDNFYNSSKKAIERVKEISGKDFPFYEADMLKKEDMEKIFSEHPDISAVIHFAGLKAVGESVQKPLLYYHDNMVGTLNILDCMKKYSCKNFIFSSSATVYGDPAEIPITENCPKGTCTNPYGWTKWMQEQMLCDVQKANPDWNVILLRYFNPIGAHISGKIGEDPKGIPNNLLPYVAKVASGALEKIHVFGQDYPTKDGTGVRDYIHVLDLALGHIKAIKKFEDSKAVRIYNLGTGEGYSVLDMIKNFEEVTGKKIKYVVTPRRSGDIAECYADSTKAKEELGWEAKYGIREMCEDSWRWQVNNPNGYED